MQGISVKVMFRRVSKLETFLCEILTALSASLFQLILTIGGLIVATFMHHTLNNAVLVSIVSVLCIQPCKKAAPANVQGNNVKQGK